MTPTTKSPVAEKFALLGEELRSELVERDDEIDVITLALPSRTHVCQIGPPGTGKTYLVDRTVPRISGAVGFSIEVARDTVKPEMVGPISIPGLKDDHRRHVTKGYLPEAHIAVINEIWNANSTLLHGLHSMTNERRFNNDGEMVPVPLSSLFCTSNTVPQQERNELAAIYDRIHFRLYVEPISAAALRTLLLKTAPGVPAPIMTWDEVLAGQAEVAAVHVTEAVADALVEIYVALQKLGLTMSGRRMRQLVPVVQAAAWLAGEKETGLEHVEPLVHCCWNDPDERSKVERAVMEVCSPAQKEVLDLSDDVVKYEDELAAILAIDADDKVARNGKFVDLRRRYERTARRVLELDGTVTSGRPQRVLADTWRRLDEMHVRGIRDVVGVRTPASLRVDLSSP